MTAKLTPEAMRAARALLGMTMQELAPKLGVSPTTLNGIELGRPVRGDPQRRRDGGPLAEAIEESKLRPVLPVACLGRFLIRFPNEPRLRNRLRVSAII
jgi:hypothetical protein